MTTTTIPVTAPLLGFRLHAHHGSGGGPVVERVRELLDLKQRDEQRAAALKALRELARSCQRTVDGLPQQVVQRLDEVAALAVELGLALANELVGDALGKGLVDPTPTVARCLRDCVHGSSKADLVLRLHPDDLASVQQNLAATPDLQEELAVARFVADPTVPRGGVRAETGAGRLHFDPREVLDRICAEVRREARS
jgi:flagellar biosynthesis/type III secretory pathway protein FliH